MLEGEADANILLSMDGIGPISILGILQTEAEVKLSLSYVARPYDLFTAAILLEIGS